MDSIWWHLEAHGRVEQLVERKKAKEDADRRSLDQQLNVELVHLPVPSSNQDDKNFSKGRREAPCQQQKPLSKSGLLPCETVRHEATGRL